MKSKTKVSILLTLLVIFLFSSIFNSRFSKYNITNNNYLEFNEKNQTQIKQSGFWNLTGNPISIDDSATGVGAHNWTWAETQPWCSGSGSWTAPYVIENVTIDGQGSGNCIEIENSDAYFIVRNCSFYNSGSSFDNAGIKLENVDNGKIINCNCSDNNWDGIYLDDSNNNTLSGITASNNNYFGIYLWNSDNNMISGNIISNNNFRGIHVRYSNNNTLSGNLLNFCGIILTGSLEEMASHSIDDTNLVNNKPVYYYVNEIGLGSNNFMNSGQIILINCTNSIISGLNISDGSGIFLVYSNYNTFSGNTINNNSHGIIFDSNSNNNNVFLNNFSNNGIDAEDNGINNRWDNGILGNYWDDYSGVDANDDGIGDTPYYISGTAGSQDNFPIWADGDEEIPEVPIISFGNYYILFTAITILSIIILEKQKKK